MSRFKCGDHAIHRNPDGVEREVIVQTTIGSPARRCYLVIPASADKGADYRGRFTARDAEMHKLPIINL